MPIYLYENEATGEVVEVIQTMNEKHEYFQDGVEWRRVYTVPTANIDTKLDPWSETAFAQKAEKPDTMGALFDRAKEAGLKRADQNGGVDPVSEKYRKQRDAAIKKQREINREAIRKSKQKAAN